MISFSKNRSQTVIPILSNLIFNMMRGSFYCKTVYVVEKTIDQYFRLLGDLKDVLEVMRKSEVHEAPTSLTVPIVILQRGLIAQVPDSETTHIILSKACFLKLEGTFIFGGSEGNNWRSLRFIVVLEEVRHGNNTAMSGKDRCYEALGSVRIRMRDGQYSASFLRVFPTNNAPISKCPNPQQSFLSHSAYYGVRIMPVTRADFYETMLGFIKMEVAASTALFHVDKNASLQPSITGFRVFEGYEGASGTPVADFACSIKPDSRKVTGMAQVLYHGEDGRRIKNGCVLSTVKIVQFFDDGEVPECFPVSARICCEDAGGEEKIGILDLNSPFAYLHDRPLQHMNPMGYTSIQVRLKLDLNKMSAKFEYCGKSEVILKTRRCFVFYSRKGEDSCEHTERMKSYTIQGWPWAEFVLFHRGHIKGMPKTFKVVKYPSFTSNERMGGFCGNALRVKHIDNETGWGVVSTIDLEKGMTIVPFSGVPKYGADFDRLVKNDDSIRSYAMCTAAVLPFFKFGFDSYNAGTIARMFNHSCNGNVEVSFTNHHGGYFPITTTHQVHAYKDQITYDYGGSINKAGQSCKCQGSINFKHRCNRKDVKLRSAAGNVVPDNVSLPYKTVQLYCRPKSVVRAPQRVPYNKLKVGKKLGSGSFGTVFSCELDGSLYALKLGKTNNNSGIVTTEDFNREIAAAFVLADCENFPSLKGQSETPKGEKALIFEKVEKGSWSGQRLLSWKAEWSRRISLCLGILKAVQTMHRKSIIHNDLHYQNILVGDNGSVHVIDFGKATSLDSMHAPKALVKDLPCRHKKRRMFSETYYWKAPESSVCQCNNHFSSDTVAVGFLLVYYLFGKNAFDFVRNLQNARKLPPHFHHDSRVHLLKLPLFLENKIDLIGNFL